MTQPTMFLPVDLARELHEMREDLAFLKKAVGPIATDAGWFSIHEASTKYCVTASTINRWIKSGRMEAKGGGAARRVRMRA